MTEPSVEEAIRARFRATPTTPYTLSQHKPFVLQQIDGNGIVLLLGKQMNWTALDWNCLEGIVPFLRKRTGWVLADGTYVATGDIDTLDEHLKDCTSTQTSRWVTVVLAEAGVVRVDKGPPLRLRLADRFQ